MAGIKLSDLKQDNKNANLGSPRGQTAIETSLQKYGAARSIVVDRDNNILCGNHLAEAASTVGLDENVIVVETTGNQVVAVKRTDLSIEDSNARELAYADNQSASLSLNWDITQLKEDWESQDIDLSPFFTEEEIINFSEESVEDVWEDEEEPMLNQEVALRLRVECSTMEEKMELASRLEGEGYRVML